MSTNALKFNKKNCLIVLQNILTEIEKASHQNYSTCIHNVSDIIKLTLLCLSYCLVDHYSINRKNLMAYHR